MSLADRENKRKSSPVSNMIKESTTNKAIETDKKDLVQKGVYLKPEHFSRIKLEAAIQGKKDYKIVGEALEMYFQSLDNKK